MVFASAAGVARDDAAVFGCLWVCGEADGWALADTGKKSVTADCGELGCSDGDLSNGKSVIGKSVI
jgi:hypothetical protein